MTRRILVRALFALEGGAMRSGTVRRIMAEVHGLEVGAHSYGCFDPVRFPAGTQIGRYVSVGPGVSAFRRNHPTDRLSMHPYFYHPSYGAEAAADVPTQPLSIESGSWLGAHVMILPGCRRIGQGAVVAAGAVLTRDVPDYAVVGGNPARLIRYRFDAAAIAAAQATRWWRRSPSRLRESQCMSDTWSGQFLTTEDARS
jgi:acetyltransferase-like isoleucine patch superfamily enzyme